MQLKAWLATLLVASSGASIVDARPAANHREPLTHWTAVSTTAMGITGDVELGQHQIVIDGAHRYAIEKIRTLTDAETNATRELTGNRNLKGWVLYGIDIPASAVLRNGNTMCGRQATTRVIVATGPGYGATELSLIFLSGSRGPFFEGWESTTESGVCGSFGYVSR